MIYEDLLKFPPYSLPQKEKDSKLKNTLAGAFEHHFNNCPPYRKLCQKRHITPPLNDFEYPDLPYLPVEIFKKMRLSSVDDTAIVRSLQSSATTSQTPSTIVIDNITRMRQVNTLVWLLGNFLGKKRRPYVILDVDPAAVKAGQNTISARAAAIRGFLVAASSASYCMLPDGTGDNLKIDFDTLTAKLSKMQAENQEIVLFGFTYVLYVYVAQQLRQKGITFSLPKASVLHIGGWKKLQNEAVDKATFNSTISDVFGIPQNQVLDIYGFTEQLGLVYIDCSDGLKRVPLTAEIIIRDPQTLAPVPDGDTGLVELITPLPHSYPGIAVLLDDMGRIVTREQAEDQRYGTAFEILGRAREAEIRGCGDILSGKMTL
ncbi:hypothetical protein ACFL27_08790 [candidate division CSSED10-310 bacterium]|uniref:Acyl-protein synthetase LuxE domain-containing protein n=1 Tax=candidate division CSSED10-310 bacterium TaxID=2855610 RepID=A0ABV6YVS6_UNCC1